MPLKKEATIDWHVGSVGSPALAIGATVDLGPFLTTGSPANAQTVIARARDAGGKQGSVSQVFLVEGS